MLNLADYGSSSDNDDDIVNTVAGNANQQSSESSSSRLFSRLPEPEVVEKLEPTKAAFDESELEADVTRKRAWMDEAYQQPPAKKKLTSKKVQIFLPDFKNDHESDSDDDDAASKKSPIEKKSGSCGLLSVLPKPASSETSILFLSKSNAKSASNKTLLLPSTLPKQRENVERKTSPTLEDTGDICRVKNTKSSSLLATDYATDSDSDLDDQQNVSSTSMSDFFGLTSKNVDLPIQNYTAAIDFDDLLTTNTNEPSSSKSAATNHPSQMFNLASASSTVNAEHKSKEDDLEYVKKLIYKNEIEKLNDGHSYVLPDDLEITDVRVDNHLSDVRENLLKNITSKPPDAMLLAAQLASGTSGGSKKTKPDPKAKRKHQITYLAHLAKEREEVLQNQWAQNRERRREARMKYGFR